MTPERGEIKPNPKPVSNQEYKTFPKNLGVVNHLDKTQLSSEGFAVNAGDDLQQEHIKPIVKEFPDPHSEFVSQLPTDPEALELAMHRLNMRFRLSVITEELKRKQEEAG
jgi:hypothetical protein